MQFDELKELWQESAQRLAASLRLNALLLQQANLRKVESAVDRLSRGATFELAVTLAGIVLLGWFGANNPQPRFLLPAIAIGVYAIALVIANASQIAALKALDYDEPVVAIAQRLESLKAQRIRTTLGMLLLGPLMWLPFFIVGIRLLFGADVYAVAGLPWLVANVLFGLAVIPLAIVLARIFGPRLRGSNALRILAADIAGRSLANALEHLATLRSFTEDE
jgi:hypothetical protein